MEHPTWTKVLTFLYRRNGTFENRGDIDRDLPKETREIKQNVQLEETLIEEIRLEMGQDEMSELLDRMERWRLIDRYSDTSSASVLMLPDGFEVAHDAVMTERTEEREEERQSRQREVNVAIAFLTLGLIAVTLIHASVDAFVAAGSVQYAFHSILAGSALIFIFILAFMFQGTLTFPYPE